ncbi:MAG: efflux RND transporter periplasmic adaptor subunit [Gammaproteobacteria bacterium]|nr:efflux RND transporter periplasmic adaptor subunit [Gammaproteobacteria bacterium]
MKRIVKKSIWIILCIVLVLLITYFVLLRKKPTVVATLPTVQTVTVERLAPHVIPQTVSSYGQTISPLSMTVKTQADGLLTSLNFMPGKMVKKGQLLATLKTSDSGTQLKKLRAQMQLSKQVYLRTQRLMNMKSAAVSTIDLLKAKLQYEQDLAQYQQAEAIYKITAPIDGVVSDTTLAVGGYVSAGTSLVDVVNLQSLQVRYQIPSHYAQLIKLGQQVTFTPTNNNQQTYTATVSYVAPLLDQDAAGVTLRADFVHPTGLLANRFGQVVQTINANYSTLVVPQMLVQSDAQGFYVYLYKDKKVFKQYFMAGMVTQLGLMEVASGLTAGDQLITTNPHSLKEGQNVQVSTV